MRHGQKSVRESDKHVFPDRLLVLLMGLVILSFAIATTATQYRQTAIESRVTDLVGNALPSIQTLSTARNLLHTSIEELDKLPDTSLSSRPPLERSVLSRIDDMNGSFRTYLTLPFFPGEKELADQVAREKPQFESQLQRYISFVTAGQSRSALEEERQAAHERGILLDRAFFRIIKFDSAQGQRLGLEISSIRAQSMIIAIILDAIAVALAVIATVLVIRASHGAAYQLERRASELEIFSGRVAHDLKNPITALGLSVDQLTRIGNDDQKRNRLATHMKVTIHRTSEIIDGLLAFARSGATPEKGASVDLKSAIDSILASVNRDADNLHVSVQCEMPAKPLQLGCPPGVLDSILSNLLRNALKYIDGTPEPRKIEIRAKPVSSRLARVEVEDNGPGIEPGKEELIFEPYTRADNRKPGIGLGLATVKRLVESYGGSVGVKSSWGHGSRFWVELPLA